MNLSILLFSFFSVLHCANSNNEYLFHIYVEQEMDLSLKIIRNKKIVKNYLSTDFDLQQSDLFKKIRWNRIYKKPIRKKIQVPVEEIKEEDSIMIQILNCEKQIELKCLNCFFKLKDLKEQKNTFEMKKKKSAA